MSDAMALNSADQRHDNEQHSAAFTGSEASLILPDGHPHFVAEMYLLYGVFQAQPPAVVYARDIARPGTSLLGWTSLSLPVIELDQPARRPVSTSDSQNVLKGIVVRSSKQRDEALLTKRGTIQVCPSPSAAAADATGGLLSQVYNMDQALQLKEAVTVAEPDFDSVFSGSVGWFLGYTKPKRKPRTTEALSPVVILVVVASLATLLGAGVVAVAGLFAQSGMLAWASLGLLACHVGVSSIAGAMRKTAAAS